MALWLEAKTHENVSIGIVNVHQATAKRHDLQRQVTYLLRASNNRRSADAAANNGR